MTETRSASGMTAWRQDRYGGPEVVRAARVPIPEPGPRDVVVRVEATGLNAADAHLLRGEPLLLRLFFGLRRPRGAVQGRDVAGTVVAVGAETRAHAVGDAVFGEIPGGGLAEYARTPADRVVRRPEGLSVEEAAGLALAGGTAAQALDLARVGEGRRVLVIGASGGVGTFAVQLAAVRGAEVWALTGERSLELVRDLGATRAFDYRAVDPAASSPELPAGSFGAVIDIAGTAPLRALRALLAPHGTLVLVGADGGRVLGPLGRMLRAAVLGLTGRGRIRPLAATVTPALTAELAQLAADRRVRVVIERVWPFAEADAALAHVDAGHAVGKTIVRV